MRAIDIVDPNDDGRQSIALPVRVNIHLRCSLACRVRVCRCESLLFQNIAVFLIRFPIHLVGRCMNESTDFRLFGRFQQNMSTDDIIVGKGMGVPEAGIHMGLGRKVDDRIDSVCEKTGSDIFRTGYITLDEGKVLHLE